MFGFPFGNSSSKARNAQQLVDFNGDGIQDMIYRVPNEGLFLRTGQLDSGGNLSFLGSKFIGNYNGGDFSFTETKTTSSGWDMGAIIYSRSQIGSSSTSTTKTYLTDANSDGLMDIVNNGEVWFNKYDTVSGKSEMTKYSEYTENMVVKAKAIQSHVICPDPKECPIDPEYPPTPIVDVVKVWIAPKDGYIRFIDNIVMASYGTIQNPPQRIFYSVEIQRPAPLGVQNNNGNGRIYLTELHAGDPMQNINIRRYNDYYTSMQSFPVNAAINSSEQLYVRSGDKVYVRLHKNTVQDYPITSDPNITYVDTNGNDIPNTFELSQGSFQLNNGTYGTNMLLNNLIAPIYLDAQGTATINVERVLLGATTDKITFRIVKENAVTGVITNLVPPQVYPQNDFLFFTVPQSLTLDVNPSEPVYLRFIVESDSHTNFLSSWNGKITVDYNAVTTANPNTPNVSVNFSAIPEYPSFAVTQLKSKLDIYSIPNSIFFTSDHNFGIQINKNITNFSNLGTGSFYYIIKKGNQVLGKRKVVVSHTNNILIEKDMDTDADISGILPVNFFTGNPTLATVGTDHLITVEVYCKTGGDYALFNKYTEYFRKSFQCLL
ncbi:hypothetical protein ACFOEQ_23580 [Chryseobacterium arachidis]|uniref:hypothetical protein n=1 Tax=Chryseobacterium arachidis TaxID=1416778 RepID=UPI00360E30D4